MLRPSLLSIGKAAPSPAFAMTLTSSESTRVILAAIIATYLSTSGYKKGSLSKSGAFAAFLVGFLSLASSYRFGSSLLLFYYTSSKLTRFGSELKKKLEDGHSKSGKRNAIQVFASSLPAVVVALIYVINYRIDRPILPKLHYNESVLNLAYLLFFAACTGDTWSSEVGLVLPKENIEPVLITSWNRRVPRGTNGGVSTEGTFASAAGGFFIGLVYYLSGPDWSLDQLPLLVVGLVGGFIGSIIDSLLGSVLQLSLYDPQRGKILKRSPAKGTEEHKRTIYICGSDLVGGETINALSAIFTMTLAAPLVQMF